MIADKGKFGRLFWLSQILCESLRHSGYAVELDAWYRPLWNCTIFFRSSMILAKFHCTKPSLVMCDFWNYWSCVQIVEILKQSFWSQQIIWTFCKVHSRLLDCCICKVGLTPRPQALWEAHFTEPFAACHAKHCIQLFATVAVVSWWKGFTSAVYVFAEEVALSSNDL